MTCGLYNPANLPVKETSHGQNRQYDAAAGHQRARLSLAGRGGKDVSLADFADAPALLVVFMCNHCPYVKHVAAGLAAAGQGVPAPRRGRGGDQLERRGRLIPTIRPAKMAEEVKAPRLHVPVSLRRDAGGGQGVSGGLHARLLRLRPGPAKLVYRGQMDSSRPGSGVPVTGEDLRAALDAVLAGKPVSAEQKPSIGCNIKWKPGNEPDYFG